MTKYLFIARHVCVLKCGLLLDERRGLTTTVGYLKNTPWGNLLLALASTVIVGSESCLSHDHILLSPSSLGVTDWLWVLLHLYSFVRDGLGNNTSDSPTPAVCVFVAMETCLDKLLCSNGCLCDTSLTPEF
jgi:hypothetical protein